MALTSPQAFRSIPQDYQGAQWTRNIKSVRHQAQAPTQGSTRQDFGCLSGACSYKRGGRAQRLCSGPLALNAEPERGVRFGQPPNLEPERAFRFSSAFERGSGGWKGISYPLASAETPANDKLSSRKFARKLRDTKLSSIDIEIALNLARTEGLGSAFERACSPPNAEPNLRFRFKHSLNLNAERASGSGSVQVRFREHFYPERQYTAINRNQAKL
ncbi:hypothetical protein B0H19DRAFT_1066581 [Mycena capillaripes]|nr:hypothetical protein B0H19DRAFT_1066581 [Mycena capillaripes]